MTETPPPRPFRRSRLSATIRAIVRTRVTTGLLVILPILVTFWLVRFVFEVMRDSTGWIVDLFLRYGADETLLKTWKIDREALTATLGREPNSTDIVAATPEWFQFSIDVFSVFLAIFILYVIGMFAANVVGKRVLQLIEDLLDRVPIVKTVYRSIKQVMNSFSGDQMSNLRRVAIIPFMSPHVRTIGFITNVFTDPVTGEELCTVLYFTTINPSTGFMLICRRRDLIELDWSAEDGVRMLLSGGISLPAPISLTNPDGTPHVISDPAAILPPRA